MIEEIRQEIDNVDKKILELYNRRINLSRHIVKYKANITDSKREKNMLAGKNIYEADLLSHIIDVSKRVQAREKLGGKSIALIGCMGSGKTHVGKELSKFLFMHLIDTDKEIVKKYGEINKIFEGYGEKKFREYEHEAILGIGKQAIISCGGGIVVNYETMERLKQKAIVVYLDRSLSDVNKAISKRQYRPLAKDIDVLYYERKPLYKKYADITIKVKSNPRQIVNEILMKILKMLDKA